MLLMRQKIAELTVVIPKNSKSGDMFECDVGTRIGQNERHFVSALPDGVLDFTNYYCCTDAVGNDHIIDKLDIKMSTDVMPVGARVITGLASLGAAKIVLALTKDAPKTNTNIAFVIYEV